MVKQQTMLANAVRSLAAEFGLVVPQGFGKLAELVSQVEADAAVPEAARQALRMLHKQFLSVRDAAAELQVPIVVHARQDETARRLATPVRRSREAGVGPITASLMAAIHLSLANSVAPSAVVVLFLSMALGWTAPAASDVPRSGR